MIVSRNGEKIFLAGSTEVRRPRTPGFKQQHSCRWAVTLRSDFLLWVSSFTCKMRIIILSLIHTFKLGPCYVPGPLQCAGRSDRNEAGVLASSVEFTTRKGGRL